jgi:SAM-dependent methyltransferase
MPEPVDLYPTAAARAVVTCGTSSKPLYRVIHRIIRDGYVHRPPGTLLDIGCGRGQLLDRLMGDYPAMEYVGCDVIRHNGFPESKNFLQADLDVDAIPMPDVSADVVVAAGVIEYLENPRRLFRELVRCCRPGGLIVVTTPNQVSLLSKISLLLTGEFSAFRSKGGVYPAGRAPLLPIDLVRMSNEVGLKQIDVRYSDSGRIPGTSNTWPTRYGFRGQLFSDDVILSGFSSRPPSQGIRGKG